MNLVFDGLDAPLIVDRGFPCVLQVENPALFFRLAQSIGSQEGRYAVEPYSLWNGEDEVAPKSNMLFIPNAFELPWDDRSLLGEVCRRIEKDLIDDEDMRLELEKAEAALASRLMLLSGGLSADYAFGIEWDLGKCLKMLGFGVDTMPGSKLIDNLISFLSLALDAKCQKVLVFVNLKTFLTENELEKLYEHVFYTKSFVLMLENKQDNTAYRYERKHVVDLDFLEY